MTGSSRLINKKKGGLRQESLLEGDVSRASKGQVLSFALPKRNGGASVSCFYTVKTFAKFSDIVKGDGVKSIDQLILNPKKSKGGLRQEKEANRVKSIVLPSDDKFSSMLVMI